MLPAFRQHPRVELVAVADNDSAAVAAFKKHHKARTYSSMEEVCDDPEVEVVYIATPHELHAAQACYAASRGKHVLIEKPVATTIADCAAIVDAAQKAGVILVVGHTHSFDAPVRRLRELIAAGPYGPVRMIHALNYTDWLYRPRRAEELRAGDGVLLNQAPHQVDMVRLIANAPVRSVRGYAGSWDRTRPAAGSFSAMILFESGVAASLTYSGYAHFDSDEFCDWIGELGEPKDRGRYGAVRRQAEQAEIHPSRGPRGRNEALRIPLRPPHHQHFGLLIASCDHADLRPTPRGVLVYDDNAVSLDPLPAPDVPRAEVIDEVYDAVVYGKAAVHDGEWATDTMKVCLAIRQSAQEQREIYLSD
jgi:phthalate 4,5-cis-dihydrodiol dehydrogenase